MSKISENQNPKQKPARRKAEPVAAARPDAPDTGIRAYIADILQELWAMDPEYVTRLMASYSTANKHVDPKKIASATARIHLTRIANDFGMSKAALAHTLGYEPEIFYAQVPSTEYNGGLRLRDFLAIMGRVEPWAGGRLQAMSWYRGQLIPALGNETAEALVQQDKAALVQSYLDAYEAGGYA